jgi:hypothetical protein
MGHGSTEECFWTRALAALLPACRSQSECTSPQTSGRSESSEVGSVEGSAVPLSEVDRVPQLTCSDDTPSVKTASACVHHTLVPVEYQSEPLLENS